MNFEQRLKDIGCHDVKGYTLISNYGYAFTKNCKRYDLRYWANCYGMELNYWSISGLDVSFNNLDDAFEWIKENL